MLGHSCQTNRFRLARRPVHRNRVHRVRIGVFERTAQGGLLPFFDHGGVGGKRQNPGASQVDFDHNLPTGLALVIVSHVDVDDVRCAKWSRELKLSIECAVASYADRRRAEGIPGDSPLMFVQRSHVG